MRDLVEYVKAERDAQEETYTGRAADESLSDKLVQRSKISFWTRDQRSVSRPEIKDHPAQMPLAAREDVAADGRARPAERDGRERSGELGERLSVDISVLNCLQ